DSGSARKRQKAEACAPVAPWFTQPASALDGRLVQRKSACACGGGCPRCRKESDALTIQTKLAIGTPGGEFEHEADAVADQVMRMPDPEVRRQCAGCADTSVPRPSDEAEPQIQRLADGEGSDEVAS